MSKSKNVQSDRFPRDSKSGHRAKSATVARKAARRAKMSGQVR